MPKLHRRHVLRYRGPQPPLPLPPHQSAHLALVVANDEFSHDSGRAHGGECSHDGRQLVRSPNPQGGYRFFLWCDRCHCYVSQAFGYRGTWIPLADVIAKGIDPDSVPVLSTNGAISDPRQGELFGASSEGTR